MLDGSLTLTGTVFFDAGGTGDGTSNSPTGLAINGEVEDYAWPVDDSPTAVMLATLTTTVNRSPALYLAAVLLLLSAAGAWRLGAGRLRRAQGARRRSSGDGAGG